MMRKQQEEVKSAKLYSIREETDSKEESKMSQDSQTEATKPTNTTERSEMFENSSFYSEATTELLKKIAGHFKSKPEQEATSFIKSLMSITVQHLGKIGKEHAREISEEDRLEYFLYI